MSVIAEILFFFVITILVDVVVLVDPRDLPVKFGQNWISDRLDIVVVFIVVDVFSYVVVVVVDPSLVKIGPVIAEILVFVLFLMLLLLMFLLLLL